MVKNPVYHGETKHIGVRYHFIHECLANGCISLEKVVSRENARHIDQGLTTRCIGVLLSLDGDHLVPYVTCPSGGRYRPCIVQPSIVRTLSLGLLVGDCYMYIETCT